MEQTKRGAVMHPMADRTVRGIVFTLVGGASWGFSGACGQYLFAHSAMTPLWLTCVRMLTSGIVLTLLMLFRRMPQAKQIWQDKRSAIQLVAFSLCGLVVCQVTYLTAIRYSNAGTATVLQYLGPVLILAYVCLRDRRLPSGREGLAVALALAGTFLLATHGSFRTLALSPLGLGWGLASAGGLFLYTMLPVQIIRKYGSTVVTGFGMLVGGIVLALVLRVWQQPLALDAGCWFALVGVVLVGTVMAYTLYLQGVGDIGAVKASMLASVEPVSAALFAVFWLGSSFAPPDLAGFACILATVVLLAHKG